MPGDTLKSNPDLVIVSPRFGSATLKPYLLGSDSLGARGRVLSLPAGGGWRRCHSAPLEDRTLPFAVSTASPGDGEHPSFPPPAGCPSRWPVKATPLFSCYFRKDIGRGYTAYLTYGPGGQL